MSASDPEERSAAPDEQTADQSLYKKARAYLVHAYTASGVVFAFLAAAEICSSRPDPRWVFVWLAVAVFIDATDGPFARHWDVKTYAFRISGRTIDDIVDYLTFTFLPLLLVWRMEWVPDPAGLWVAPALVASLFGFANTAAKQETGGFFLGFPSYWNIVAFYVGLWAAPAYAPYGPYASAGIILILALLTVLPVRFIYPNRAPRGWRGLILGGAALWTALLLWMLPSYPSVPPWLMGVSLIYPAFYLGLSTYLDLKDRAGAAA